MYGPTAMPMLLLWWAVQKIHLVCWVSAVWYLYDIHMPWLFAVCLMLLFMIRLLTMLEPFCCCSETLKPCPKFCMNVYGLYCLSVHECGCIITMFVHELWFFDCCDFDWKWHAVLAEPSVTWTCLLPRIFECHWLLFVLFDNTMMMKCPVVAKP